MHSLRLFSIILFFGKRHRKYLWGIPFAFFAAIFSGLSLSAMLPVFDAIIMKQVVFQWPISKNEKIILSKTILRTSQVKTKQTLLTQETTKLNDDELLTVFSYINWEKTKATLSVNEWLILRYPLTLKFFINEQQYTNIQFITIVCLFILLTIILKTLFILVAIRAFAFWGYRLIRDIRKFLIFDILYALPVLEFTKNQIGMFISRLGTDIEYAANIIANEMRDGISNFFYLLVYFLILGYLNLTLLLFCIIVLPLIFLPSNFLIKKIRASSTRGYNLLADLHNQVKETINGIRIIRMINKNTSAKKTFKAKNDLFYWKVFKRNLYERMSPMIVEFTSILTVVIVFIVGSASVDNNDFSGGSFLTFILVLASSIRPIIQLTSLMSKLQNLFVGLERALAKDFSNRKQIEFLQSSIQKIYQQKSNQKLPQLTFRKNLEFMNVSFSYQPPPATPVLNNLSFSVRKGEKVMIIGPSGCGKSTIFDLIMRFLELQPKNGSILIDGVPINELPLQSYRKLFGIVQQDIFLFHGSIRDNIAYGISNMKAKDISDVAIINAAKKAFAHTFIEQMKDGYETQIGNRGLQLSGGQRQRLAMTRIMLRNPEIILLDEATSSLDRLSQMEVEKSLQNLGDEKTVISISHDINRLPNNMSIFKLSDGKLTKVIRHASSQPNL